MILNLYRNDMPVYSDCLISELPLELLFEVFGWLVILHNETTEERMCEYTKHKLI